MDQGAYLDAVDVDIPLLLFDDVPLTLLSFFCVIEFLLRY